MKRPVAISIALIAALALGRWQFGSSETLLVFPLHTPGGIKASLGLGIQDRWGTFSSEQSEISTTYSDGRYRIEITETPSLRRTLIRVVVEKLSGEVFRLDNFSLTAYVPRSSIQGIWYPGADPSSTNVMATDANQSINDVSDANYGIPYIAAASANSRNVFALGIARQDLAVAIGGQPAGDVYEFRLNALTSRTSSKFDESFYISTNTLSPWSEVATDYATWVDALTDYHAFPISPRAFEPLYGTWYWSGDWVNDRLYLDTAKLASEAGIRLYLADSGWDTEAGEYQKWLAGKTGDYRPPPDKFRDLSETFNTIRSQYDVGIDLWLQPFAVGRQSMRYPETRDNHIQVPLHRSAAMGWGGVSFEPFNLPMNDRLENVNLCPRLSSTQGYLTSLFTEVATKYKPEGYWLDFIDGMPTYCIAAHVHDYDTFGQGFKLSLATIKNTILLHDPQAIVHFRARYANLNTKPYANVWQSGDSPGDYDRMRLNSIRLRPFSKGVVFAADQMYWPEGTSEVQVSKFIMTSVMIGVPAFGPTLLYSPPDTLAMLKAWVTFYHNNRMELATGRFSIFGQLAVPNHKIESGDRTFAYIRNLAFGELTTQGKTIFLMNATNADRFVGRVRTPRGVLVYGVKVFNRYLVPEGQEMRVAVDPGGVLNLNLAVQQGGMVMLTPLGLSSFESE
jgi:hypothetical protein